MLWQMFKRERGLARREVVRLIECAISWARCSTDDEVRPCLGRQSLSVCSKIC